MTLSLQLRDAATRLGQLLIPSQRLEDLSLSQ